MEPWHRLLHTQLVTIFCMGDGAMNLQTEARESLLKAKHFVLDGGEQILAGRVDEEHGVSASPGATALASLSLLALGRSYESAYRRGAHWLWQHRQPDGWGKYEGDKPDEEITKLARTVLQGSLGGLLAKLVLLAQARQFSGMILSLGQRVVPGLKGPTPEEIVLPRILEERVLAKLPVYGRPVVVAASLLAAQDNQKGITEGLNYLSLQQMADGSWAEDIVATGMGILTLLRFQTHREKADQAGRWLVQKQYSNGSWPAFDQLYTWAVGWAVNIFAETTLLADEEAWLKRGLTWLKQGQNLDGSYGTNPPFTHPDIDDTAVALSQVQENQLTVQLLRSLQNEDGSWGTFPSFKGVPPNIQCEFPVYIPSADVTVHVLEALWHQDSRAQEQAIWRGLNWLLAQQGEQGDFPAAWFEGRVYTSAQVLELLSKWKFSWEQWRSARQIYLARRKSLDFLLAAQREDGGWGCPVESALTLAAFWRYQKRVQPEVFERGMKYLLEQQRENGSFKAAYRGVYAKGWNYEEPISTALTAIRALDRYLKLNSSRDR